jgi:hypothetical protein
LDLSLSNSNSSLLSLPLHRLHYILVKQSKCQEGAADVTPIKVPPDQKGKKQGFLSISRSDSFNLEDGLGDDQSVSSLKSARRKNPKKQPPPSNSPKRPRGRPPLKSTLLALAKKDGGGTGGGTGGKDGTMRVKKVSVSLTSSPVEQQQLTPRPSPTTPPALTRLTIQQQKSTPPTKRKRSNDDEDDEEEEEEEDEEEEESEAEVVKERKKKKVKEELKRRLIKCWEELMGLEESEPFREPVSPKYAPDYRRVILRPMDLITIKRRFESSIPRFPFSLFLCSLCEILRPLFSVLTLHNQVDQRKLQ